MQDKISLAGDLGGGKSTVANILIERLGAEYYSTGAIVRSIAESRGMTVGELNKYMETHPEIDHEIDAGIAALSEDERFLIIDSRMAWHFTQGTFKVYLSCDIETSALRIMHANRKGEHNSTLEETIDCTRSRRESEKKRYTEQYGVDIKDLSNYSLIVDTTVATPDQVADRIAREIIDGEYNGCFGHSLGHSVGLYIHEAPGLSRRYIGRKARVGEIFTVEPGIYVYGKYGCRIEDMIAIEEGGICNFTHSPKDLIEIV